MCMWGAWHVVREQEKGAGSGQVRCGRNQQVGGTVAHGLSSRGGTDGRTDEGEREGGAQRSSGLEKVGVSDCHGHTNTQGQIQRREDGNRLD